MVNGDRLVQLVGHYLAMVLLIFFVIIVGRMLIGELDFLIEIVIAFTVATMYILSSRYLGILPDSL